MNPARAFITLVLAAVILWRNLPGALLFLWPAWRRTRPVEEDHPLLNQDLFSNLDEELGPLGFKRLGARLETAPLGRPLPCYDFVNAAEHTYACAYKDKGEVLFYLLTPLEKGGFVLTANHKRQGVERPGYLSGGLPEATPERLLPVHRQRVERLRQEGFAPLPEYSLEARVRAAQEWFQKAGVRETRLRHANSFILSAMGVAIALQVLQASLQP